MNNDHKRAILLAAGAMLQIQGTAKEIEAATLRGDADEVVRLRQRAHDLLDSHMDQTEAGARAARIACGL